MNLPIILTMIVRFCRSHAMAVTLGAAVLAAGSVWVTSARLGISTDTYEMFSPKLRWRQQDAAFNRDFPQFQDLLVAVIDADLPEIAEETAAGLAAALAADKIHFTSVRQPDALPYFARNAFLFLDQKSLAALLDQTIDAQPFLGQLAADPSARGLFAALTLLGLGVNQAGADVSPFAGPLLAFHQTLDAAGAGRAKPLSWQRLLGGNLVEQAGRFRFVLVQPVLDYTQLQPGGAATSALRAAAAQLPWVKSGAAHVRLTGSVALADEEFATVAQGAAIGTLASAALVVVWLMLAVRSWRLILPILATLGLGLALTTAFAALAVGTLNLISVAFAILFVGIAVDFAIQFCVRYREMRHLHPDPAIALDFVAGSVGLQVFVAALGTAAGFLAFVPTDFSGVAELGLIAGGGMIIAFIATITFLPALLALTQPLPEAGEIGWAWAGLFEGRMLRGRRAILAGFAAVAVLGLALVPQLRFDSDPLHTKVATTEAMVTLRDLMDSPLTSPYSADIIVASRQMADDLAARLSKLPDVAEVLTVSSFVPADQAAKLALVQDAAGLLAPTLARRPPAAPVTIADLRLAAGSTLAELDGAARILKPDHPLMLIASDLRVLLAAPDDRLLIADQALTRFLPLQLDRLRAALAARAVTDADLPAELRADWQLPDGRVRVQALAAANAQDADGLRRFTAGVTAIAPDAGGAAIIIAATATTILDAFRTAAIGAVVGITLLLLAILRRIADVAIVMAALLLSALLTVVVVVTLGLSLNFANIIALPLLLGVGVSFNIYFVMNWRAGRRNFLGSATARAILFSALTTATAFGSLALSVHPGTASMGLLLLLSLACTLVVALIFVPCLLGRTADS
ncbi:MAG: MMPL family transporter [Acetobacteraceae bacterium]|nr:MMPL family transporter [Acetobacteraceae bacterium]